MGRPHRIDVPGGYYHVASRGNNKQTIYLDAGDRAIFLDLLERVVRRAGWIVYAYCLMSNHYHLVLNTPDNGLSAGMQLLNGEYSRRTNRIHGRIGHLFHNRFAYAVIETERHLFNATRYVHLNPVRAGLCVRADDWAWSGHRACLGLELPAPFHSIGALLRLFGTRPVGARRAYAAFVQEGQVGVSDTTDVSDLDVAFWDEFA